MTNFAKVQTTLKQFVYFLHADWPRQPKLFGKFTLGTDDAWPDTDFEVLRSVFWETLPCGTIYAQMTAPTCIDVEFRQFMGIRDEGQEHSFTRAFEVWGRWRFGDGWECTPAEADPTPAPASSAAGDDQVMTAEQKAPTLENRIKARLVMYLWKDGGKVSGKSFARKQEAACDAIDMCDRTFRHYKKEGLLLSDQEIAEMGYTLEELLQLALQNRLRDL